MQRTNAQSPIWDKWRKYQMPYSTEQNADWEAEECTVSLLSTLASFEDIWNILE